ncbi:MAG: hydrolase CocE/NonD family protein [Rhodospirillales bacterium]|jgi:putative CocE/NonD family hydrolase|nr:hydrolase CocE/NonD family protein [Rhodospirillales bacterium]
MTTRDGVRLDADVYRPETTEPCPMLLMRQPYGRRIASTICYAHPSWYAARGYIVVIQDVRGRGTSEGTFELFANDLADGADTVAWAASLAGGSGNVGMYGFSYQGTDQLLAAAGDAPALKALAPAMIGWDLRTDWAYENDAFCLQAGLGWATQIGAETARLAGDTAAFDAFFQAARALPVNTPIAARPPYMTQHAHHTHYGEWLDRPADCDYWRRISPSAFRETLDLPMLFIGGWYDSHLPGTLAGFRDRAAPNPETTRIVVGPWAHFPWGRRLAGRDFGPDAVGRIDQLQIRWFDHWLKGIDTGLLTEPAVRLFDMGRNAWREFGAWPESRTTLYLAGDGRASIDETEGALEVVAPADASCDFIVHDPWRPVPSVGGAYGTPNGPADRSTVDARPDVLTFTTSSLDAELRLAGDVAAELFLACDAPSFDVSCVLCRVLPNGQSIPLAQGYRLVKSGTDLANAIVVPMRATCATIGLGERLRLAVAASCFPAYPINPGTGGDPTNTATIAARIVTLGVHSGGGSASRLQLTSAE